jgi:hypothetical protein
MKSVAIVLDLLIQVIDQNLLLQKLSLWCRIGVEVVEIRSVELLTSYDCLAIYRIWRITTIFFFISSILKAAYDG